MVSPSSALLPFWGRVPLRKWTTEKKGTLILTSLLEDLALVPQISGDGSPRSFPC